MVIRTINESERNLHVTKIQTQFVDFPRFTRQNDHGFGSLLVGIEYVAYCLNSCIYPESYLPILPVTVPYGVHSNA